MWPMLIYTASEAGKTCDQDIEYKKKGRADAQPLSDRR